MSNVSLTIFYDALCPLCVREIAHYRRRVEGREGVEFVDITALDFVAEAHGLDATRVHQVMHVKEGQDVRTGVDAFIAIWRVVPGYARMAWFASIPFVKPFLKVLYAIFARVRPWLPRRKIDCANGTCQRG